MASACVNSVGTPPENFLEFPSIYPSCNWFGTRISFNPEIPSNGGGSKNADLSKTKPDSPDSPVSNKSEADFEFRLNDPVQAMLPADELFSDGKLVPLLFPPERLNAEHCASKAPSDPIKSQLIRAEITGSEDDLREFSPKAPRCSSRWKELLGLKKGQSSPSKSVHQKSTLSGSMVENARSLKRHFLRRNPKAFASSSDSSSMTLPLLKDSDSESVSLSSRLSLSSSSSGADHEDFPRLSFDFDKPNPIQVQNRPRGGRAKAKSSANERGGSVDSPRLNASGKVVFQGLERSSSSPCTFNGGSRPRPRGMERSYSANVRVTPVLNVPLCTLRGSTMSVSVFGFGQFFSPQKKEKKSFNGSNNGGINGTRAKSEG